jgi:hypothetical protein
MSESSRARQLLEELAAERQKGTSIRRGVTYLVLGMFALAVGNVYFKVKNFDLEIFTSTLQKETSARVWPLVEQEMDKLARDAGPALSAAMAAEAESFAPKFQTKVEAEAAAFSEHLHDRMKASLDTSFRAAMDNDKDKLLAQFPQFKDDPTRYDELVTRLNAAAQTWAMSQLDTTFKQHIEVLQSINAEVAKLTAVADAEREKNGNPEAEEVLELFVQIMNSRLEAGAVK